MKDSCIREGGMGKVGEAGERGVGVMVRGGGTWEACWEGENNYLIMMNTSSPPCLCLGQHFSA